MLFLFWTVPFAVLAILLWLIWRELRRLNARIEIVTTPIYKFDASQLEDDWQANCKLEPGAAVRIDDGTVECRLEDKSA